MAGGGPVSIEARLRSVKVTILGNPLPLLASNLVAHPDIKSVADLPGHLAGISRIGSSTDQGFRYLFRKNGFNVDRALKILQMGGNSSRVGERIIAKYIKINDPKLAATEFEFVSSLVPDYITPTIDGMKLILENFGKEYPGAHASTRESSSIARSWTG